MQNSFLGGFDRRLPAPGQQQQPQKKQKGFWTDQISTGGGIGGALAGAAGGAAIGSVVPVVGTAIGGLAGAILGGALGSGGGELAENFITNEEDKFKNVGKEALLGGAFSAPPLRIARGVVGAAKGLATGAAKEGFEQGVAQQAGKGLGKKLEHTGQQLLVSQANIPRGMGRQLNVGEVFSNLNKYGLNQLDDIGEIAPRITGENGLLSASVRKALSKTKGVDTTGFRDVAESLIENNGTLLQPHIRKNITSEITQVLTKAGGGAKGSLSPLANSLDVFDVVKSLEKKAASFGKGKPVTMLTPDEQAARSIYSGMAAELKDRLFTANGIEQTLPEIKETLAKQVEVLANTSGKPGLNKLASDIRSAQDINTLRSLQSPFVRGGQVAAETALSQSTSGLILAQGSKGLGRLGNPLQIGSTLLEGANAPAGSALIRTGQFLNRPPSTAFQGAGGIVPTVARQGGQGVGQSVIPATVNPEPSNLEDALLQTQPTNGLLPGVESNFATQEQESSSPYSQASLMADIQRDPANTEKYLELFASLQKAFPSSQTDLTASQQKTAVTAQNALNDVSVLADAIESGSLNRNLIPFSGNPVVGNALGVNNLNAALYNIGDVILRSRTGAAAPKEEVEKFVAGYLPRAGESRETQLYKLQRALSELQGMVNPPAALGAGSAPSLEDALLQYR